MIEPSLPTTSERFIMKFPKWVAPAKAAKAVIASNRLRYLVGRLAVEFSADGSLKALCDKAGVSHSTICIYVRQGRFSPAMATKFEKTFGTEFCKAEWLVDPSTIKAAAQ